MSRGGPATFTNAHRLTRAVGGWEKGMLIPKKQERLEVGSSTNGLDRCLFSCRRYFQKLTSTSRGENQGILVSIKRSRDTSKEQIRTKAKAHSKPVWRGLNLQIIFRKFPEGLKSKYHLKFGQL